jgi:hypothetical protein
MEPQISHLSQAKEGMQNEIAGPAYPMQITVLFKIEDE